jgi:hypothetical protein
VTYFYSVIMLWCSYTECRNVEYHYAVDYYAECRYANTRNTECCNVEYTYAECHYAEAHLTNNSIFGSLLKIWQFF